MKTTKPHRCGKHAVNINPNSPVPVWAACPVHSGAGQVGSRFVEITESAFSSAESGRLSTIVDTAMLD